VAAAFTGTLASGGLSLLGIQLPIVLAGMGLLSLAIGLVVAMPENNFTPSAANDVGAWTGMIITARDGLRLARSRPVVRGLLIISLLAGLSSEAVDRLWQLHLMRTFTLPPLLGAENPAIWFAAIELVGLAVGLAASLLGNRYATRWLGHANPGGVLAALTAVQVAGVCALALSGWLWLAVLALWFRAAAVVVAAPVLAVWLNGSLEPSLRATVLSIDSQTGAIGQLAGGPPLGLLAKRTSVPTALLASACILAPTVAIFLHYRGRSANHADG
jgi:hypothetical protein